MRGRASAIGELVAWGLVAIALAAGTKACHAPEGCLDGDDGACLPAPACTKLAFPTCADRALVARRIGGPEDRGPGLDALAARGDVLLANDRVRVVFDAIDAPHALAPTGGNVIDLAPVASRGGDATNVLLQAVGILPRDAAAYRTMEIDDASSDHVAVVLRGTLDGRPEIQVVTRWELRPCEPGVRVRTELFHGGRDPESFFLCDAAYWGGREGAAFTPLEGRGFVHPELSLEHLGDAFAKEPFFASQPQNEDEAAYAVVPCGASEQEAFHSDTVSAAGRPRAVVLPGDGIAFERFVAVAPGPGASRAIDTALAARASLFGEASVVVRGRVHDAAGVAVTGGQRDAMLLFRERDGGRPWNTVVPAEDGSFEVRLPADRAYRAEVSVLGRRAPVDVTFSVGSSDATLDVVVPRAGVVEAHVTDAAGAPVLAELVLVPVSGDAGASRRGSVAGAFDVAHCDPWLGPAHGGSPACNRVLVGTDGAASFAVPEGSYWAYATRGPFATLARTRLDVAGGARVRLDLTTDLLAGLVPEGVLSADFHVHGGASFDSSLPDRDRARTFVTTGVDVVAATDHDVVTTYGRALAELGIEDRVIVLPGVETTGQILFYEPPGQGYIPRVIGHFNFWPLPFDPSAPRNGAPWDERLEPGALFDRVVARMPERGVVQLNHPYAAASFGRDEGYLRAIGYDPRHVIGTSPSDSSPEGQLAKRPLGGRSALDFDTEEVMNGTSTRSFAEYRAAWHGFLQQGILRAGTANSDSHTLAVEVLGYPRNLVAGGHTKAAFDRARFDEDVRRGRMTGTNGPVIVASVEGRGPSLDAFTPSADAALVVEVRAAPWIPVAEVRVVVNGAVVRTIDGAAVARPADPFGKEGTLRYRGTMPLRELLAAVPPEEDAWIVVEAGLPIALHGDTDDDGVPDTTDNDGNGVVDARDREGRDDETSWVEPGRPAPEDPRFHAWAVVPGHWSTAFTNPWLVDRRGDGWRAPAR